MKPSHIPFRWLKTIEESIARKQLIVKPDAPGRQFLALISDRVNTQISAFGKLTHPNHPKVTQSWKQTGKNCLFWVLFCQDTCGKPRHQKIFPTTTGRELLVFPVNCRQSMPEKSTQCKKAPKFLLFS